MPPDRDEIARWYADRHLRTDDAIREILYLPEEAPPSEIRFIEINRLISESTTIEPIDFGVNVDGVDGHTLYVLDVTPGQWREIERGAITLPEGWRLRNRVRFGRN